MNNIEQMMKTIRVFICKDGDVYLIFASRMVFVHDFIVESGFSRRLTSLKTTDTT